DNIDEARLTVRALAAEQITNDIYWVKDGQEARDFLLAKGQYTSRDSRESPKLILLDLELPNITGLELVKIIKSNPDTQTIPVVVLTSYSENQYLHECYRLGVNSYIVKPVSFQQFLKMAKKIGYYWMSINQTA
ncbi:MAG: response regulator, partial [Reichenbachiella sp.]